MVERAVRDGEAVGSSPMPPTIIFFITFSACVDDAFLKSIAPEKHSQPLSRYQYHVYFLPGVVPLHSVSANCEQPQKVSGELIPEGLTKLPVIG